MEKHPKFMRHLENLEQEFGREGCCPYPAKPQRNGYCVVHYSFEPRRLTIGAHRLAYELLRRRVSNGITLDHQCRNRRCCNPWHLEPMSQTANNLLGNSPAAINARKTHCPKGHPLSGDNVAAELSGRRFHRKCKTCRRERDKAHYHASKPPLKIRPNALKTHCPQGHAYAGDNLTIRSNGDRHCKRCHADRATARARRDPEATKRRQREQYLKHREKRLAYARAHRAPS